MNMSPALQKLSLLLWIASSATTITTTNAFDVSSPRPRPRIARLDEATTTRRSYASEAVASRSQESQRHQHQQRHQQPMIHIEIDTTTNAAARTVPPRQRRRRMTNNNKSNISNNNNNKISSTQALNSPFVRVTTASRPISNNNNKLRSKNAVSSKTASRRVKSPLKMSTLNELESQDHLLANEHSPFTTTQFTNPSSSSSPGESSSASSSLDNKKKYPKSTLLTKDEEARYAFALKRMRMAIRMRDQLVQQQDGLHIHPTEESWATACGYTNVYELRHLMQQGQEARSILVQANVGLVTSLAKKLHRSLKTVTHAGTGSVGTILTLHDMIQEGNLGLMEAAERYCPEKGFRFSTYATWWIRQRMHRAISDSSRTIRLPAHVHGMLRKMRQARYELAQESSETTGVSDSQVAQKLGLSEEKVRQYAASSRNVVSLEVPLHATRSLEDTRTLGDTLASDAPTPDEDAEASFLRADVWQVMEQELADVERQVILHRFGFLDHCHNDTEASSTAMEGEEDAPKTRRRHKSSSGKTVAETAAALGISRDRVRLVEARALNKLRHPQRNYRLREYVSSSSSLNRGGLVKQRRHMRSTKRSTGSSKHPSASSSLQSSKETENLLDQEFFSLEEHNANHQQGGRGSSSGSSSSANAPRADRMWFF